jgi:hypothetical protein
LHGPQCVIHPPIEPEKPAATPGQRARNPLDTGDKWLSGLWAPRIRTQLPGGLND